MKVWTIKNEDNMWFDCEEEDFVEDISGSCFFPQRSVAQLYLLTSGLNEETSEVVQIDIVRFGQKNPVPLEWHLIS